MKKKKKNLDINTYTSTYILTDGKSNIEIVKTGRYNGSKPKQCAQKAFTVITRKFGLIFNTKIIFAMWKINNESRRNGPFLYIGTKIKIKNYYYEKDKSGKIIKDKDGHKIKKLRN